MARGGLIEAPTPRALLDRARLERNCRRMREVAARHGVRLRPHVKTAKSVPVAEIMLGEAVFRGVTVSTLAEAEHFAAAGFDDLTYAVGIVPSKIAPLAALAAEGARVGVITDDLAMVDALEGSGLEVWIEIDCGGARGGVAPDGAEVMELARRLGAGDGARLAGVLTHAGHSYACRTVAEIERVAEQERAAVVLAAERIRETGVECPGVSVGSTPTALHARSLEGVTEIRAGVYVFFDLFQYAIGSCARDDLALSVVASVVSRSGGTAWIDAGALALSSDRSMDRVGGGGYGEVTALDGTPLRGAPIVGSIHQEHGRLDPTDAEPLDLERLPVGALVRVWPNHACMTAAMYEAYDVLEDDRVIDRWPRLRG